MMYYAGSKIIPAPFLSIAKEYQKAGDGTIIGSVFNIVIKGVTLAYKGSPSYASHTVGVSGWGGPYGRFWNNTGYPPDENVTSDQRLDALMRKEEALRTLFSIDGGDLEIQPWDGMAPMKCNPRIKSLVFPDEQWFEKFNWELTCEADVLYVNGLSYDEDTFASYVSEANEDWNIEFGEVLGTFKLTHTVSAKGKRFYDVTGTLTAPAWQNAKSFVQPKVGLNLSIPQSGLIGLPSYYGGFNRVMAEQVGVLNGTYAVTETWILSSGSYTEETNISTKQTITEGKTIVNIDGTIKGLCADPTIINQGPIRTANAEAAYASISTQLYTRAMFYMQGISSGIVQLNPIPTDVVVGLNPVEGILTYTSTFDNRPSNCIPGAIHESFEVRENYQCPVIAKIPVIGRIQGSVLQNVGTNTDRVRELSINVIVRPTGNCNWQQDLTLKPVVDSVISGIAPVADFVYKQSDVETWNWRLGAYSRNVSWIYQYLNM